MKRTALKRGKQLKRTSVLKRSSKLPQRRKGAPRRGPEKDAAHLAFVRSLPCSSCGRNPPSDPNHDTHQRGLGQKADDRRTHPMCRDCHELFHAGRGRFADWTKLQRRAWQEEQIAAVLAIAPTRVGADVA